MMKIHEYQAKEIFREYGIRTPTDTMVTTPEDAVHAAELIGLPVVIKAQVHSGGRGKAGGVKKARTLDEVRLAATDILKLTIKDCPVHKIVVTPVVDIKSESYLS